MEKWLTITMLGVALLGAAGAATAGGVDLSIGVGVPVAPVYVAPQRFMSRRSPRSSVIRRTAGAATTKTTTGSTTASIGASGTAITTTMTTDGASRLAAAARARRAAATDAATKEERRACDEGRAAFSSPPDGVAGAPVTRAEHDATMTAQNLSQNL